MPIQGHSIFWGLNFKLQLFVRWIGRIYLIRICPWRLTVLIGWCFWFQDSLLEVRIILERDSNPRLHSLIVWSISFLIWTFFTMKETLIRSFSFLLIIGDGVRVRRRRTTQTGNVKFNQMVVFSNEWIVWHEVKCGPLVGIQTRWILWWILHYVSNLHFKTKKQTLEHHKYHWHYIYDPMIIWSNLAASCMSGY